MLGAFEIDKNGQILDWFQAFLTKIQENETMKFGVFYSKWQRQVWIGVKIWNFAKKLLQLS